MQQTPDKWNAALKNKRFRTDFIISVIILAVVLLSLAKFLEFAEARQGVFLNDPVLNLFTASDFTWIIFAVIYLSLLTAIISLLPHPSQLLFAVQLYAFMAAVRIIAMYLLPLEPPEGIIVLRDPFVEFFGTGNTLTKDLFFSGHTASILIFVLTSREKIFKIIFSVLLILIAVLVILQKVHYTIDVYAAVFFTLACYFLLITLKRRLDF